MNITDYAYITSMKDVVMQPALDVLEAAMLPAKEPRRTGALAYVMECEARAWRFGMLTGRRSASGKRAPWR